MIKKTIKAKAKASFIFYLIVREIDQCIDHGKRPIKNTKTNAQKISIKDLWSEKFKAQK